MFTRALLIKIALAALVLLTAIYFVLRPKQESGNFTGTWATDNGWIKMVITNQGDHYLVDAFIPSFMENPKFSEEKFTVKETDPLVASGQYQFISLNQSKTELTWQDKILKKTK